MKTAYSPAQSPMSPIETLVEGLTRDELTEFVQAVQYLSEAADRGGTNEVGGASAVLNRLSPNVRERFMLLSNVMETPRVAPFTPKMSEADHADAFGLDPDNAMLVKSALDGNEVAAKLTERMGGADRVSTAPPSLRELIASATDKHTAGA